MATSIPKGSRPPSGSLAFKLASPKHVMLGAVSSLASRVSRHRDAAPWSDSYTCARAVPNRYTHAANPGCWALPPRGLGLRGEVRRLACGRLQGPEECAAHQPSWQGPHVALPRAGRRDQKTRGPDADPRRGSLPFRPAARLTVRVAASPPQDRDRDPSALGGLRLPIRPGEGSPSPTPRSAAARGRG